MKTRPHARPTAAQREARRTDFVRAATLTATIWLLLSVPSWLLTGCAATPAGPTAEQRAERAGTYTDAAGWEVPVPADTARVAGW